MGDLNVPKRLLDLVNRGASTNALSESSLRARFGDPSAIDLEPGQVWRARWDDVALLVLVASVGERDVRGVPVTIDPPAEGGQSVVLEPLITAFQVPVTAWSGLIRSIPIRVLDTLIDMWPTEIARHVVDGPSGGPFPEGTRPGRPIESELDQQSELRAELMDHLDQLCAAPTLPMETPGIPPRSLATVLGRFDLAALCTALDLPQPAVMKLLRGTKALTPAQVAIVADVTGVPVDEIAATARPIAKGLVIEAEHPRWRPTFRQRARRLGTREAEVRLDVCYQAIALAARQTGASRPDWNARLHEVLRDEDRW
jgi:hypothetical protein